MEFTANRLELLEMSRKVMRLANDGSPIEALRGIYMESDEDTGEVSMIATNYEAAIFMKKKAYVQRTGKLVIHAKLLTEMLALLAGEQVKFSTAGNNLVHISSGKCVYGIQCLPAEHYPKPAMPFPDEAVKLSGICGIAKKTVFAVSRSDTKPALQCVCLKVRQNSARAAASDGLRMVLVKGEAESSGTQEFLLPAKSFQTLASISDDEDVFDVGIVGNETVFTKKDMLFSIKQYNGSYIDTNTIIQAIKPKYTAISSAELIYHALDLISVGSEEAPVNLRFTDGEIYFRRNGKASISSTQVQARTTGVMPGQGFFYTQSFLLDLFRVLRGTVKLEMDENGMMLVKAKNEIYFQIPISHVAKESKAKGERQKLSEKQAA